MIRARIKKWLSSWGKENPEAMRPRDVDDDGAFDVVGRPRDSAKRVSWSDVAQRATGVRYLTPEELERKNADRAKAGLCPLKWAYSTSPEPLVVTPAQLVSDQTYETKVFACICEANGTGRYVGMTPLGGRFVTVAFRCEHGNAWNVDMLKADAQRYIKTQEEIVVDKIDERNQSKPSETKESPFQVHRLNETGMQRARIIQGTFEVCLIGLEQLCGTDGREMAIVRTKLEEASFFAKKAMAKKPENQEK